MTLADMVRWLFTGEIRDTSEKLMSAAEKGDVDAQLELGLCFYTGRGMPKNEEQAVQWFHSAAGQGHPRAQFYLGHARFAGKGLQKDHESAYAWFSVAAANGYRKAKGRLAEVAAEMTSEQVEEGRRLSRELQDRLHGMRCRTKT